MTERADFREFRLPGGLGQLAAKPFKHLMKMRLGGGAAQPEHAQDPRHHQASNEVPASSRATPGRAPQREADRSASSCRCNAFVTPSAGGGGKRGKPAPEVIGALARSGVGAVRDRVRFQRAVAVS